MLDVVLTRKDETGRGDEDRFGNELVAAALRRQSKAAGLDEVHAVACGQFLVGIAMGHAGHVLEAIEGHQRCADEAGQAVHNRGFSHGGPAGGIRKKPQAAERAGPIFSVIEEGTVDVS